MLKNLNVNESQSIAISFGAGAMLVLAGPGSGKTFVTTQRIKYLIEEHHVSPENILVITFTKAAATEMHERFNKLMDGKNYPVNFGTFHAIFFQILRHTYKFDARNIIREGQKYSILKQILGELPQELIAQEANDNAIGSNLNGIEADADTMQGILSEISNVKNNDLCLEEFKSDILTRQQFIYVYQQYKGIMKSRKLIDFDDMILICRDLFKARPEVLKLWQERFKYILIDEFQDINPIQYEIVKLLAKPEDNLFIVGDDDQSIYGFRGAKPEIMLNFKNDYPNAKQVLLNVNYRSKRDIVETGFRLIEHNKQRFAKAVTANNQSLDGVKIYSFTSKDEQAKNIALLIKQYMCMENAKYSDIAILYRTNNSIVYTAQKLVQEKIPFYLKEKPKNIFETSFAKDITAYLRYSLKEEKIEDFYRIMNKPVRYIKRNSVPLKPFTMQELLNNNKSSDYVVKNIISFYEHLSFIKKLSPFSAINFIRKGVGYDEYIKGQGGKLEELDNLQQSAKAFETIEDWLYYIDNYDMTIEQALKATDTDAVNIVTMHASKGLEWKVVIIPDVNEKIVPHKKAVKDCELEEERRIFYVALTRAKDKLFIFYVHEEKAGNILPSQFIEELK